LRLSFLTVDEHGWVSGGVAAKRHKRRKKEEENQLEISRRG
jgi:hypothetical protein